MDSTTVSVHKQAARIIAKFGGPYKLVAALAEIGHRVAPMTVYRWTYAAPRGTGGLIPREHIGAIESAAFIAGYELTAADWDPR